MTSVSPYIVGVGTVPPTFAPTPFIPPPSDPIPCTPPPIDPIPFSAATCRGQRGEAASLHQIVAAKPRRFVGLSHDPGILSSVAPSGLVNMSASGSMKRMLLSVAVWLSSPCTPCCLSHSLNVIFVGNFAPSTSV